MSKGRFGFFVAAGALAVFAGDTSAATKPNLTGQVLGQRFITASAYANDFNNDGQADMNQDGGSAEQFSLTKFKGADGKTYVMTVGMTSNVPANLMYWQCACSSFVMEEDGPHPLATEVLITANIGGERNCNHPAVAGMGLRNTFDGVQTEGVAAVIYGSDIADPNNTTAPYVTLIDTQCRRVMTSPTDLMVQNTGNDNAGPYARAWGEVEDINDPEQISSFRVFSSTYENNGGGVAWGHGFTVSLGASQEPLIGIDYNTMVYTNLDIARQSVVPISNDRIAYFGAYGNARPPTMGVIGAIVDGITGQVLSDTNDPFIVARTDEIALQYYNDPVFDIGPYQNVVVGKTNMSSGRGDDGDTKGTSFMGLHVLEITDNNDFTVQQSVPHGEVDAVYQTHSTLCTGYDGRVDKDTMSLAVAGASPTNGGTGSLAIYDFGSTSIVPTVWDGGIERNDIPLVENSDSMYQSNMYGGNPGDQGRNWSYCLGNIENPAYDPAAADTGSDVDGFMPWVKSFWAVSMSAKDPAYAKNGQYLVFVPATGDFDTTCTGENCDNPCEDPTAPGCPDDPNRPNGPGVGNEAASGCACVAAGESDSNTGAAGLLLVGLGLAAASRRRREEV